LETRRLTQTFHNDPEAASQARRALRELRGQVAPSTYRDLGLLISELVTNAVRHALCGPGTHVRLDVVVSPSLVRAEVCDRGMGFDPSMAPGPDVDAVGGWGLYLLDELADLWGVVHDEERGWTRVWFELEAPVLGAGRHNGAVHRLPASLAQLH
jgi:anti-sigma regulatory factor (Ser/Thr protein kinase)